MLTLGSLFDGIGGFPLAGAHNGITPLWASEIEAFPIEVTKLRFPEMRHFGDITKLDGAKLPPVDIITGGSPCQDLSVAGQRAGLAGERSGLFMEQIRIVKEMRREDERNSRTAHAVRPRYMVWENVPGAFSSADGEDFRAVLEETCRIADGGVSVPRPPSGVWKPAGAILGDQFSVAWRVLDAQYWGVAQRRKRIFLVADFAGHSAGEILFEQDRLFGNPAPGGGPRQGAAPAAPAGAGDTGGDCLTPWDVQSRRVFTEDGKWPALYGGEGGGHGYIKAEKKQEEPIGFDGYNGDLTGDKAATLGVNCGMSTGRNGVINGGQPMAFAANQRDEVRDLGGRAGALQAQPGMKQQTFVAIPVNTQIATRHKALGEGTGFGIGNDGDPAFTLQEAHSHGVFTSGANCLTPWDTQQGRVFTPEGVAPTLAGADGGGGRNPAGLLFAAGVVTKGDGDCFLTPDSHTSLTKGGGQAGQGYPCVLTAGFSAGAAPAAGSIGYQEECAPTLKGSSSGTNMVPSVLCLNDQGGQRMDVSEDISGTLRSRMDGHPPLVLGSPQGGAEIGVGICPTITSAAGTSGNNQPVLFDNHGQDCRFTGPVDKAQTVSAGFGMGGNNQPLVATGSEESYCIAGNIIDRQVHNGGNGFGYQPNISYTLNTADRHCVFSQQRSDEYMENGVACTQAARQYKDATDLVCEVAGLDCRNGGENGDLCGTLQSKTTGGYSLNNVHPVRTGSLIRRLTPLECERLQGFPDGWTDIDGGSDSARYKALGNSVAIPCVVFVLRGIAYFLRKFYEQEKGESV